MSSDPVEAALPVPFSFSKDSKAASDILPYFTFKFGEEIFIENAYQDISAYSTTSSDKEAVLLFPPVNPRFRFLIHQVVETNFLHLQTFSVGADQDRRTVVCPKAIYKMETPETRTNEEPQQSRKPKAVNARAIYRPPPARSSGAPPQEAKKQSLEPAPVPGTSPNACKKPPQALYVPPGRKSADVQKPDLKDLQVPIKFESSKKISKSKNNSRHEIRLAVEEETNRVPSWQGEGPDSPPTAPPQTHRKISRTGSIPVVQPSSGVQQSTVELGDLMESTELAELSNQVPVEELASPQDLVARRKQSHFDNDEEEDSWEKLYNETGDLLRPEALEELTLAVGRVRILQPSNENYAPILEGHDEDLTHVIELYDFPSAFKTEDLFNALSVAGKPPDFSLKWVDDTHALAIYGSPYAAVDALASKYSFVKMRPLAQACKESRTCARRISTALQPFKPRPATSATMAKRLVSTALGIKNTVSPEQRKMERQMLADAKAKKRLAAQQKEAAWEGTLATP